jgi:cytochrome c553
MKTLPSLTIALAALCGFISAATAQDLKAAEKGKVALCIGCHGIPGYQASFPEVYRVPMIAGQNAKYIASALMGYRKGERKHPTMRAIAGGLTDQDIADVSVYYENLGKNAEGAQPAPAKLEKTPSPEVAKLLAQANCTSCHGENFSKPIDASYPKLAGQYPDYLYSALKAYQTDKNPQVGRSNPIMMGMARPFTHAELKTITAYLGSLPTELKTVSQSRFR